MQNQMELTFSALPQNEAFARVAIAAFAVQLNPTLPEMADIKTAVSEAVTNAIVHAYEGRGGQIEIRCTIRDDRMQLTVEDFGKGIADIEQALQPFFTTGPSEERSGMGFAVMQAFMDELQVHSEVGKGTQVCMQKRVCGDADAEAKG